MKRKRYTTPKERASKRRKIINEEIKKNKPTYTEYDKNYKEYYNLLEEKKKIPRKIKKLKKRKSKIKKDLKLLKSKLGSSKPYLKNAIKKIPDDVLKYIVLYMEIPDMYNYFSSCKRLYNLIGNNTFIWKNIANRYRTTSTYRYSNMIGYFQKEFIDNIYKEESWKEVVKIINIDYSSIYKKIMTSYFIFQKDFRKTYNGKMFMKTCGRIWRHKSIIEKEKYEDIQYGCIRLQSNKCEMRGINIRQLKTKLFKKMKKMKKM